MPHLHVEEIPDTRFPEPKGKGVATPHDDGNDQNRPSMREQQPVTPFLLRLYDDHTRHLPHLPLSIHSPGPATITATTALHTPLSATQKPPPSQVHVLILTWAKHDRRGADGQLLTPGLDGDTEALRACLKRRGYRVQCRAIPADYPTAAVETLLDRFLERSAEDSLLVVYYQGYGCLEREGRMMFSR